MKPIMHFQIPEDSMNSSKVKNYKNLLNSLKERFSNDYDLIITPWQMQADNMINITISPDTDIEEVMRRLNNVNNSEVIE